MMLFEIVGWAIISAVAFLFICYVTLGFWCAIDDLKNLVKEKHKNMKGRIKHE